MSSGLTPSTAYRGLKRKARRCLLETLLASRQRDVPRPPPDFIIAGAQRCGTTSLFRALEKHPAMMSNVIGAKGVHYFDTNFQKDLKWYLAHFSSEKERSAVSEKIGQSTIVGEASPYYLYHPAVAERMAKVIPEAKIVVLLRDPVKRAISHHLHMVWEGHEHERDLETVLDLEASRLHGIEERLLSESSLVSKAHQDFSYLARGHYAPQLERLYANFSRNNVLVMATETLVTDSEASLARIQSFIGLKPEPSVKLEKRNASKKVATEPRLIERLNSEFKESNHKLRELLDIEVPWL